MYRQSGRRRFRSNSARIKIQAPSRGLVEEILEALLERFPGRCITSPILPSREGGYHGFCNVMEDRK